MMPQLLGSNDLVWSEKENTSGKSSLISPSTINVKQRISERVTASPFVSVKTNLYPWPLVVVWCPHVHGSTRIRRRTSTSCQRRGIYCLDSKGCRRLTDTKWKKRSVIAAPDWVGIPWTKDVNVKDDWIVEDYMGKRWLQKRTDNCEWTIARLFFLEIRFEKRLQKPVAKISIPLVYFVSETSTLRCSAEWSRQ